LLKALPALGIGLVVVVGGETVVTSVAYTVLVCVGLVGVGGIDAVVIIVTHAVLILVAAPVVVAVRWTAWIETIVIVVQDGRQSTGGRCIQVAISNGRNH